MKVTASDLKRNAIKAIFVIFVVAVGFAIATNLELPANDQANLPIYQVEARTAFA